MAKHKELPQILVLKRTFIQKFPNGQTVGLYHSESLDQYIAIPITDSIKEEQTTESIIHKLKYISDTNEIQTIMFEDLSELNINKECADIILGFINESETNIQKSDKEFLSVLKLATENTEINKEQELSE